MMRALLFRLAASAFLSLALMWPVPPALAGADDDDFAAGFGRGPVLRPAAMIEDEVVRLGDLFDNLGDRAGTPVAWSPDPGREVVLDVMSLMSIARTHDVSWQPRSHRDRIVVTRASQMIGSGDILEALRIAVVDRETGREMMVEMESDPGVIYLPSGSDPTLDVRNLRIDERTGRFTAVLAAPADNPLVTRRVAGRASPVVEVPVPARRVMRGEVVGEQDIRWTQVRADRVSPDTVLDLSAILGQAVRRTIREGDQFRAGDLHEPEVVSRGSSVVIVYRTEFMTLTVRGRALESGGRGSTIRVMNEQSNQTVEASIESADTVIVRDSRSLAFNAGQAGN